MGFMLKHGKTTISCAPYILVIISVLLSDILHGVYYEVFQDPSLLHDLNMAWLEDIRFAISVHAQVYFVKEQQLRVRRWFGPLTYQ